MPRPPHDFNEALGQQIVMQSTGRWMSEPTDPGAPGYYMGEVIFSPGLIIYSRYFDGITTGLPIDTLSPRAFSFIGKRLLATESVSVVPAGRVAVTLEFTIPTLNELAEEFVLSKGSGGSGAEPAMTLFSPLNGPSVIVYAGGSLVGAPNGASTIPAPAPDFGAKKAEVASAVGFAVGQWVKIRNTGGGEIQIVKISAINGLEFTFESDILMTTEDDATIETINDAVPITEVTDYTVTLSTGDFIINETAATTDKLIWVKYCADLLDYEGGDFWLIFGDLPLPDYIDPVSVSTYPGAIFLGATNSIDSSFTFEKDGSALGKTFTLYAIARDGEAPPNASKARAAVGKFIPARPVSVTTSTSDSSVTIDWNDVTSNGSLADGYNVVRNPGQTFIPAIAEKLNDDLITTLQFTDADSAPNRVSVGIVAAPINGQFYTYSLESGVDNEGKWTISTLNQRIDQGEIFVAEKQLSD